MKRLFPIIVLGPLFLSGAVLAQQIDPPSLELDVGPGDIDVAIAEAHEAIAGGISEALVATAGDIAEALNPDVFSETDPGVALLELGAAIEEAVRGYGEPKEDIEKTISAAIEELVRSSTANIALLLGLVGAAEEEIENRLQQGRALLDSDFSP